MKKIGSDSKSIDIVYKELSDKYQEIKSSPEDSIKNHISSIEFDEFDGTVNDRQQPIIILAKMAGDKNRHTVADIISDAILASPLMEAVARIKRPHTEAHPAVHINPEAKMRNKIVKFIGGHDRCRCTKEELKEFMNGLSEDEEIGKAPNKNYISSNKRLFSSVKVGAKDYIKLTDIGKRVNNHLKEKEEKDVNENTESFGDAVDGIFKNALETISNILNKDTEGIPEKPKKNKRVGGIEFHPPIHNDSDAPEVAQDSPSAGEEKVEIKSKTYESSKGYYGIVTAKMLEKKLIEVYNISNNRVYTGWFKNELVLENWKTDALNNRDIDNSKNTLFSGREIEDALKKAFSDNSKVTYDIKTNGDKVTLSWTAKKKGYMDDKGSIAIEGDKWNNWGGNTNGQWKKLPELVKQVKKEIKNSIKSMHG